MGKFVIKQSNVGFHFVLKASNGEIIATSQVYTTKDSCKKGIESVKRTPPRPRSWRKRRKAALRRYAQSKGRSIERPFCVVIRQFSR